MTRLILVNGHTNSDTDSICSAIAYAHYKSQQGYSVLPIELSEIKPEIVFAFERFGGSPPELIVDIIPKVKDLDFDHPNTYIN